MSRIGRLPVAVPAGVQVKIDRNAVEVIGPKGVLSRSFSPSMEISQEGAQILVKRGSEEAIQKALHGTTRALIQNMVTGVSTGFSKILSIEGVGYRAEMEGSTLVLYVGYSHPVKFEPPAGINFEVETKTRQVKIIGYDVEVVGQTAANIRKIRPPEPYKGKGIRYAGEYIRIKPGKSGKGVKE